jgi:hypothetical protein
MQCPMAKFRLPLLPCLLPSTRRGSLPTLDGSAPSSTESSPTSPEDTPRSFFLRLANNEGNGWLNERPCRGRSRFLEFASESEEPGSGRLTGVPSTRWASDMGAPVREASEGEKVPRLTADANAGWRDAVLFGQGESIFSNGPDIPAQGGNRCNDYLP